MSRIRMNRKARMTQQTWSALNSSGPDWVERNRHMAVQYARWLADRDGIGVSNTTPYVCWAGGLKQDGQPRVNKPGTARPFAVMFNRSGQCVASIDIPNWDHEPVVEEHRAPTDTLIGQEETARC